MKLASQKAAISFKSVAAKHSISDIDCCPLSQSFYKSQVSHNNDRGRRTADRGKGGANAFRGVGQVNASMSHGRFDAAPLDGSVRQMVEYT